MAELVRRKTFEEIIEEKKAKGQYRILRPDESLRDPKAFKAAMRKVHRDYLFKANASIAACRDRILNRTINRY